MSSVPNENLLTDEQAMALVEQPAKFETCSGDCPCGCFGLNNEPRFRVAPTHDGMTDVGERYPDKVNQSDIDLFHYIAHACTRFPELVREVAELKARLEAGNEQRGELNRRAVFPTWERLIGGDDEQPGE